MRSKTNPQSIIKNIEMAKRLIESAREDFKNDRAGMGSCGGFRADAVDLDLTSVGEHIASILEKINKYYIEKMKDTNS